MRKLVYFFLLFVVATHRLQDVVAVAVFVAAVSTVVIGCLLCLLLVEGGC